MGGENVRVVVRARPMNSKEKERGSSTVVEIDTSSNAVSIRKPGDANEPPKTFTYDAVYDWNSTQRAVYDETAFPLVESVLEGYNGTIFAYGQTGCGKTHTMEGKDDPEELRGIIPNAFAHIFGCIDSAQAAKRFLVRCSYLEIYNEEIRDLLAVDPKAKLDLRENKDKGVYVKDLSQPIVKTVADIASAMKAGAKNRTVGATLMNQDSSRSHSIFTIYIEMSEPGPDGQEHIKAGKLNLVDLAGSERQGKTGATGERLKEATKINLSLSALGNVISALVDGKSHHVPYRDSKLTRLLQDSLGGNTKTVMVAAISPADYNYDETLSTLRYAARAKNITNKPKVNEDPKDTLLREYQEEIMRLKRLLEERLHGSPSHKNLSRQDQALATAVEDQIQRLSNMAMSRSDANLSLDKTPSKSKIEFEVSIDGKNHSMSHTFDTKTLEAEKSVLAEDRDRIATELQKQQEQLQQEREERERLQSMLASLEEKLVVGGGNDDHRAEEEAKRIKDYREFQLKLKKQKKREKKLKELKQKQEEEMLMVEKQYHSLQEEVEEKTKFLQKLRHRYKAAKSEIRDLQQEFEEERETLLDSIRDTSKQLRLYQQIVSKIINRKDVEKIIKGAAFDEERNQWKLPAFMVKTKRIKLPTIGNAISGATSPNDMSDNDPMLTPTRDKRRPTRRASANGPLPNGNGNGMGNGSGNPIKSSFEHPLSKQNRMRVNGIDDDDDSMTLSFDRPPVEDTLSPGRIGFGRFNQPSRNSNDARLINAHSDEEESSNTSDGEYQRESQQVRIPIPPQHPRTKSTASSGQRTSSNNSRDVYIQRDMDEGSNHQIDIDQVDDLDAVFSSFAGRSTHGASGEDRPSTRHKGSRGSVNASQGNQMNMSKARPSAVANGSTGANVRLDPLENAPKHQMRTQPLDFVGSPNKPPISDVRAEMKEFLRQNNPNGSDLSRLLMNPPKFLDRPVLGHAPLPNNNIHSTYDAKLRPFPDSRNVLGNPPMPMAMSMPAPVPKPRSMEISFKATVTLDEMRNDNINIGHSSLNVRPTPLQPVAALQPVVFPKPNPFPLPPSHHPNQDH